MPLNDQTLSMRDDITPADVQALRDDHDAGDAGPSRRRLRRR